MASSGIRLGAWDYLRWKDIQPIERQGKVVAAKIIVYAGDDDRLGKNDDWKISFYNYYKPCDYCGKTFLKSDLIYVTTNNDDSDNVVETLRLRRMFNSSQPRTR